MPRRSRSCWVSDPARGEKVSQTHGTREAGGQCPQEAPGRTRARQRLPGPAVAAVPQGQGAAAPLHGLCVPGPQGSQGCLPATVDSADQRRGARRGADLQQIHPGAPARRRGRRSQDAGRARRLGPSGVRRAGPGRQGCAARRRQRARGLRLRDARAPGTADTGPVPPAWVWVCYGPGHSKPTPIRTWTPVACAPQPTGIQPLPLCPGLAGPA